MTLLDLHRHPASKGAEDVGVAASALYAASGAVVLEYRVSGAVQAIAWPSARPAANARRCDDLWRKTCFEAFFSPPQSARYVEVNAAPSGAFQVYGFEHYRATPTRPAAHVEIETALTVEAFRLTARLSTEALSSAPALDVSLACILQSASGEISYWALDHRGGRPDFHDRSSFVLPLTKGAP